MLKVLLRVRIKRGEDSVPIVTLFEMWRMQNFTLCQQALNRQKRRQTDSTLFLTVTAFEVLDVLLVNSGQV